MHDRYISDATMLDEHERELVVITVEEAGEVIEQATMLIQQCTALIYMGSKTLRFGKEDKDPEASELGTNIARLAEECGHLKAMVRMLCDTGLIDLRAVGAAEASKLKKVHYYLQHRKGDADAQADGRAGQGAPRAEARGVVGTSK